MRFLSLAYMAASLPSAALAHAHLISATPAVDSTVRTAPAEIAITYSERLEPKFSTIEVQDASGARVDTGNPHTEPGNDKRLMVGLKPLKPGNYKVVWHVTSTDTHKTEGPYTITVNQ